MCQDMRVEIIFSCMIRKVIGSLSANDSNLFHLQEKTSMAYIMMTKIFMLCNVHFLLACPGAHWTFVLVAHGAHMGDVRELIVTMGYKIYNARVIFFLEM